MAQPTGSITLRPAARVEAGAPVRLIDVAALRGPAAEALGEVIVLETAGTDWRSLDAEEVRAAIDAQADPVWGHLALAGAECRVRALGPATPDVDTAAEGSETPEQATDPATVRGVVEARLAAAFACDAGDLRLEFAQRDAQLLRQTALGRTVDVQPTGFSERLPLRITIYEGERLIESTSIRVGVLIRREVAVTPVELPRGHSLEASDLVSDTRWVPPDVRPVALDKAAGLVLRTRLAPGTLVTQTDVETPILVRRGEQVQVHSANGAVSLQVRARALEAGREGEVIRCAALTPPASRGERGSRQRPREFLARLVAPGVAVAMLAGEGANADPAGEPAHAGHGDGPSAVEVGTPIDSATGISITPAPTRN